MATDKLISKLGELGEQELLIEVTVRYLFSLPPELADAAFRGAILRWFTPEVLQGVSGAGTVSGIEGLGSDRKASPDELCDQLRKLRFAEEYPGRGYSFHDMTRELVLSYLWEKERDFYRKVSAQAAGYFAGLLNAQIEQIEQSELGEIDPGEVDWDLGVERAYHSIVADEQEAIEAVGSFLDFLLQERKLGTYHAVIQALSEHAEAGRMLPDSQGQLKLWRLQEAIANYNITGLETMTSEILQAPDASTPGWLKAEATYQLASGLCLASRYDEAENHLKQNLDQYKDLKDPDGWLRAVIELGTLEFYRENYDPATDYFADALDFHVQQLRVPESERPESEEDRPLLVFDPAAWHRRELYPGDEGQDQKEETPQSVILYFIEFDTAKMGIDITGQSEDEALQYEWPVYFDDTLAKLWLNFGYLQRAKDLYDSAAACARLAGQMYVDLENLTGAQAAVQLLRALGANLGDLETVKAMGEFEHRLFDEAIARRDQTAVLSGLISQAASQFDTDKYEEAGVNYEKAYSLAESLNLASEKAACLDGLARLNWIRGEYDQALERFRTAGELYEQVQNREGWAGSLLSLGDLHLAGNQLDRAEECFLQALDRYNQIGTFSGRVESLLGLSVVAKSKGEYDRSFAYLNQALDLSRSHKDTRLFSQATVLSRIAQLYLSLGHVDKALAAFDKALGIADRISNKQLTSTILLDHAQLLSDMAEYEPAVQKYGQVIDLDLNNSQAYAGKAWALENIGKQKVAEAKEAYEKASELQPDDWWLHKGMANALKLSGDKQAATAKYKWVVEQIEQKGVQPADRSMLAWCCYQLGEYEKAENIYRQVVASNPNPISDYFDLGLVLLCREQYPEALKAYEQAATLLQQRYPALLRLGLIYVAIDDLQEAVEANRSLSGVKEYNQIKGLLDKQQRLARSNPDGKPGGDQV